MPDAPTAAVLYRRHRFPAEIISHAVWLYFRFNDSCLTDTPRSQTRHSSFTRLMAAVI